MDKKWVAKYIYITHLKDYALQRNYSGNWWAYAYTSNNIIFEIC